MSRFTKHVSLDRQAPELPIAFSRAVERAVDQGLFDEGAALPSVTELADAYGVSPATIRNGLAELVARNVLVSRRGPGGGTG
jgi:GntR family transcriptional repressor for pyruvate dehydrogenase complex